MGHEKKKKKDKDRDRERRRRHSRTPSPSPDGADGERRRRRKHKKHKERKRRHESEPSGSPPPAAPPPPSPGPGDGGGGGGGDGGGGGGGGGDVSLSIAETNRLRAELGLRPLDIKNEGGTGETAAEGPRMGSSDTYAIHKRPEHMGEKKRTEKLRERLAARREQRAIEARLARGRGLGESSSDEDTAAAWVAKSRQLQKEKEMASKRAALLDDLDAEFGVGELVAAETEEARAAAYTAGDLRGLTVEHQPDRFVEGREVVLTIKDRGVLDEEDDVLVNVNMVDDERHQKNVAVRRQKPGYRPDDQDEWDEEGNYRPRTLLSQYDEELEGEKKSSFVIGQAGQAVSVPSSADTARLVKQKLQQKSLVSLDMPAPRVASEFYTEGEMASFKKVKKKVRKVRKRGRALRADDLLPLAEEDQSTHLSSRTVKTEPADSDDEPTAVTDDTAVLTADLTGVKLEPEESGEAELSRAIERSRRLRQTEPQEPAAAAAAGPVRSSTEQRLAELAAQLRRADPTDPAATQSIVLNSTAEFCRSLGDIPTYGMAGNRDEEAEEIASLERELAEERRRTDMERAAAGGVWEEVGPDEAAAPADAAAESAAILEEEPEVGSGLAGALKLAMHKGYVDVEEAGKKGASQQVLSHLRAQNYSIEDKSAMDDDRNRSRSSYSGGGPVTEFRDKAHYKPEVKLEYIDDQGRLLSSKEAFRYLSHKFHGKGSGKMKTEKREKKIQESLLMAQMNSTDTPLNTLARLQEKQKELQSPYVVLSGAKLLGSGASGSQVAKH
ncbi:U4/U6.U5 tri-snRNP-associated protein 1-like [Pollicipes pollicipes]|uniref:U4/U6.U5 tri-snRNP-associated protein 1-like n=1 Tax=Pollicipes pollicipes TaxID=41117 RepID=UPI0018851687|nr:U4/U6.U5 tri-snRNP-associated protein 1-like [Pollicipes pollicipes]